MWRRKLVQDVFLGLRKNVFGTFGELQMVYWEDTDQGYSLDDQSCTRNENRLADE